jgi:uncharacterized lipoprotein YajG
MTKTPTFLAAPIALAAMLGLGACSKTPDTINVADTENSAGAALENSAAELDATTDNLVDNEVANMNAEAANTPVAGNSTGNSNAN